MIWSTWYQRDTITAMAMTLRLTDEENRHLAELAVAEGCSKQDVMRNALAERWSRQNKEQGLQEAIGRVLPRYRGLLERFGTV